jgi:hypothetical protein
LPLFARFSLGSCKTRLAIFSHASNLVLLWMAEDPSLEPLDLVLLGFILLFVHFYFFSLIIHTHT